MSAPATDLVSVEEIQQIIIDAGDKAHGRDYANQDTSTSIEAKANHVLSAISGRRLTPEAQQLASRYFEKLGNYTARLQCKAAADCLCADGPTVRRGST